MCVHLKSVDLSLWVAIEEGPFVPQKVFDVYPVTNHQRNGIKVKLSRRLIFESEKYTHISIERKCVFFKITL